MFPSWISKALVDDAAFGRAYASVPDQRRALLKAALVRSWEGSAPSEAVLRLTEVLLRSGLRAVRQSVPRPAVALFFDGAEISPARLLAALVPALAVGVPEILAVRLGGRGHAPAALLTALELAGVERLAQLPKDQGPRLLEYLAQNAPSCAVLALGDVACATAIWRGHLDRPLGLWLDRPTDLDLEALRFAQPDAVLEVWGPGAHGLGAPLVQRSGSFETFIRQNYPAVYTPVARREACLGRVPLVLSQGCESCWLWSDLEPGLFLATSTAWSLDSE